MIPALENGETLFSWGARTRLILGLSARQFSLKYFGTTRAGRLHEFPPKFQRFVEVVGNDFTSIEELIRYRSPFGAYLPFCSKGRVSSVVDAFRRGNLFRATSLLGLNTNKLGRNHPLRYCVNCAEDDLKSHGYARWQANHQLPGTWVCLAHRSRLLQIEKVDHPWQMPLEETHKTSQPLPPVTEALLVCAATCVAITRCGHVDAKFISDAAISRLVMRGVIENPKRINALTLFDSFCQSQIATELALVEPNSHALRSNAWIHFFLKDYTAGHPLKAALIWAWVTQGDTWDTALTRFAEAITDKDGRTSGVQLGLWPMNQDPGYSHFLERLEKAMPTCDTEEALAQQLGVFATVIRRWLRDFPQLRDTWKKMRLTANAER